MASSIPSSSLLPFDLVENILYKVPVKALLRFKSTCKQWYALLNDKRFIYKHLELSREGLIRGHDDKLYKFINLETLALSNLQGPSKIYSMIHCDGLLLCAFQSDYLNRRLGVWNPFLHRIKWIRPSIYYSEIWDMYGFGYDNVSRENYKILRFKREKRYEEVEIYEFKTKLWRSVDYSGTYSWYPWHNHAVSVDGNMYWFAERHYDDNYQTEHIIQCFDFSREIFKETCCLPFVNRNEDWILSGFRGDSLSLLFKDKNCGKIQVWVTNNLTDGIVSWSKYFNVNPPYLRISFRDYLLNMAVFIHKTNRILLWCEEKEKVDDQNIDIFFNVYEISEGVVEKLVETGRQRQPDPSSLRSRFCVFVPSLVPVPE